MACSARNDTPTTSGTSGEEQGDENAPEISAKRNTFDGKLPYIKLCNSIFVS